MTVLLQIVQSASKRIFQIDQYFVKLFGDSVLLSARQVSLISDNSYQLKMATNMAYVWMKLLAVSLFRAQLGSDCIQTHLVTPVMLTRC